jgi:hypothetical protein
MGDEKFDDLLEKVPPAKDLYKDIIVRRQKYKEDKLMSQINFMLDTLLNSTDEYVSFYIMKDLIGYKPFDDMVSNLTKKGYNVYIEDDSISICYGYVKPFPKKKPFSKLDITGFTVIGAVIASACLFISLKR